MTEEPTHRVVRKAHHRTADRGRTTFEVGDPITPTEAELESFPDRFERIDRSESEADETATDDAVTAATEDATDASDDDENAEGKAEGAESDDESDDDALTAEWVESADYDELRRAAKNYDDVNGNWGEERLRAELAAKTE